MSDKSNQREFFGWDPSKSAPVWESSSESQSRWIQVNQFGWGVLRVIPKGSTNATILPLELQVLHTRLPQHKRVTGDRTELFITPLVAMSIQAVQLGDKNCPQNWIDPTRLSLPLDLDLCQFLIHLMDFSTPYLIGLWEWYFSCGRRTQEFLTPLNKNKLWWRHAGIFLDLAAKRSFFLLQPVCLDS